MDARNAQQRKRRAEMTDKQREESKRRRCEYQRQYRARKRAELQNNSTTVVLNQDDAEIIVLASSLAGEKYLSTYAFHQPPDISSWTSNHIHIIYVKVCVWKLDYR
jgi:hypothetical protein